jgi:hypothetical protein
MPLTRPAGAAACASAPDLSAHSFCCCFSIRTIIRSLRALQEERGLADEEARERDRLYERAEALAAALSALGDDLRAAVADVNAAAAGAPGGGGAAGAATPLAKATRILNNQLQALTVVDERTDALAAKLDALAAAGGA